MKQFLLFIIAILFLNSCLSDINKSKNTSYTNKGIQLESNKITPEILWKIGKLGEFDASPNQKQILYSVTYTNIEENNSYTDIYVYDGDKKSNKQITHTKYNERSAAWRPDGKRISYISSQTGDMQLWEMNVDGSSPKQISNIKGGITGYKYAPDLSKILFTIPVKLDTTIHDLHPDLPHANARIENDIMYRHWDHWHDGSYSHIQIANYSTNKLITKTKDIMEGEKFDTPLQPFGGIEQIEWSPDSKSIAYTCKKQIGYEYAISTNSDIYLYNLEDSNTTNLTKGMMGYDKNPVFSKDGSYILFESMKRNGYESDKNRLMKFDFKTNSIADLTKDFSLNIDAKTLKNIDEEVYFISDIEATAEIFSLNLKNNQITQLTDGIHDYRSLTMFDNQIIASRMSMSAPVDLFLVNTQTGNDENVTKVNKGLFDQLKMGKVESRWITTTDNKKMKTWIIYPPDFDPKKKYPTLLYCQGGPQQTVSQFWSYRWNFQLMAANGYIIVAPNRRGLPGFGQEWLEQISGDYGGQNMQDYFSAIDSMAKEPYIDENRLGAIGASYGGYSVYWLAGNHNKRFKAFVAHCGIFNFEQMYSTTEEMFFVNWDLKGAYWDKENIAAQKSYSFSPHKFVQNWDTPILVIHGQKDFRIPYTQGMGAFNSAIMKGIPARLLFFPEENHWVLSPQNGILWHREFFKWLDTYLK